MHKVVGLPFRHPRTHKLVRATGVRRKAGRAWVRFASRRSDPVRSYGLIAFNKFNKLIGREN